VVWPANIWQKTFQCMDAASFETILDQANITNITYWDLNLTNKPRSFNWQIEHDRTNQDWGYDLGSPLEMNQEIEIWPPSLGIILAGKEIVAYILLQQKSCLMWESQCHKPTIWGW
jgi:hypothetical protein